MTLQTPEIKEITQPEAPSEAAQPRRICFVCTGNTCRSPMAEAVANALAQESLWCLPEGIRELALPEWEAFSAGIYAAEGDPIAEHAVLALETAGIEPTAGHDYHFHRAHRLSLEEAEQFDRLVGMTREHAMALILQFPQLASKITVLPQEIFDPYGGSAAVYSDCLQQIQQAVRQLLAGTDRL